METFKEQCKIFVLDSYIDGAIGTQKSLDTCVDNRVNAFICSGDKEIVRVSQSSAILNDEKYGHRMCTHLVIFYKEKEKEKI